MMAPHFRCLNLITYLDYASKCMSGARLFKKVTSEDVVVALRQAIEEFGSSHTILSYSVSCFVGRDGRKKPIGTWTLALRTRC